MPFSRVPIGDAGAGGEDGAVGIARSGVAHGVSLPCMRMFGSQRVFCAVILRDSARSTTVTLSRAPRSSVSASSASQAACAPASRTASQDLVVVDMLGQAVGAEHEDVAAFELAVFEIELRDVVHADRAGDDVPARRVLRLLRR